MCVLLSTKVKKITLIEAPYCCRTHTHTHIGTRVGVREVFESNRNVGRQK